MTPNCCGILYKVEWVQARRQGGWLGRTASRVKGGVLMGGMTRSEPQGSLGMDGGRLDLGIKPISSFQSWFGTGAADVSILWLTWSKDPWAPRRNKEKEGHCLSV